MKRILVLGSGLDAALIAEALRARGVCEVYGLVTPEQPDPPPTISEMTLSSVLLKMKSEGGPRPDPHVMPEKSVRMQVKSR